MGTADLHATSAVDYYTDKLTIAVWPKRTIIKQARKENPNLLLLDSVIRFRGTPLEYYHNKRNNHLRSHDAGHELAPL